VPCRQSLIQYEIGFLGSVFARVLYMHGLFEVRRVELFEGYSLSPVLRLLVCAGTEIETFCSLEKSCLLKADNRVSGGRSVRRSYQELL
jgi:hypothetical protein